MSWLLFCTNIQQRNIAYTRPYIRMMSTKYKDAVVALNNLISNAEIIKKSSTRDQAHNIVEMSGYLKRLNIDPRELDKLKVIHVSGTKGKGSTCSYTESILRSHGYKTGFYSSPHLLEEKVDVAVIEVGIGGEYDNTNIIRNPYVVGITPLDLDHTSLLGHTLDSIAWNKGGIMKTNAKAFTVQQPKEAMKILQERSVEKHCSLDVIHNGFCSSSINSNWPQNIQTINAGLALSLAKAFIDIDHENGNNAPNTKCFDQELAKKAIMEHKWPGRYEIFRRKNCVFYLDGAHTQSSLKICRDWFLSKSFDNSRLRVLIFNLTGQRDSENFLSILKTIGFELTIFIPNVGDDSAELLDTIQLVDLQLEQCKVHREVWNALNPHCESLVFPSFLKALNHFENTGNKEYDVLITGSIMLVGAAMSILDPTLNGLLN
ncbi:folylpolyglutamate synthase, mitochondrial-like isoform X2 [Rhynchophorus ferrugineus]|uniref:folylpolyglutamate synthase, mitochondrial-like isoform X2 n=1 Tax=Rhynchophorus ferrugineus TaxID=354439 RepID=UPI003FCC5F19